jgi:copper transport protein
VIRLVWRGALTAVIVAAVLALAPPARAHSTLMATEPPRDRVLEQAPEHVMLRFDEPVETALGSLAVYDGGGDRVDTGRLYRPSPERVAVAIDGELERGTYTVAWRVISADSDPINGAFVFHVEAPGSEPAGIAAQVLEDTPFVVSVLYLGGRFLDFVLLLLCVGGAAAMAIALRSADWTLRRRLLKVLAALGAGLAVISLIELPLQGAAAQGTGLADAFTWDVVWSVADTRFGHYALLRVGLAVALGVAAVLLARRSARGTMAPALLVLLAAGLVVTPSLSGHASVSGPVSLVADATHVQAAAAWTGGLAFVVAALVLARDRRWELASTSVPRFSAMAVASVAALLVAGAINGYLQVRAWRGLWETQYGVLLLVKIGLVLPLLGLGAYNNRFAVPRLRAQIASTVERRRFLRLAGVELAIMVGVVGVTAGLVNAPPARTEVAMHEESETELRLGPFTAHMEVMPGELGANSIHLMFVKGRPDEVTLSARLESKGIGPLRYRARPGMEPGEFVVRRATFAPAGEWELRVDARRGEFDLFSDKVHIQIDKES